MGFESINNDGSGGFATFEAGATALATPKSVTAEYNSNRDGELQLRIDFDAVSELDDSETGEIAGWMSSKVTIQDDDSVSSNLGIFLETVGATADVLAQLGADKEMVEKVRSGEERFHAASESENEELARAVASAIQGKVLRVATAHVGDEDPYSKVDKVHADKTDENPGFEVPDQVEIRVDHGDEDSGSDTIFDEETDDGVEITDPDGEEDELGV